MTNTWHFDTKQIHAAHRINGDNGATSLPIYQSNAYQFPSAESAANRFALKEFGPIYTRLNNPTCEVVEERISQLEGGIGGLLTSSGAAAITLTILTIAQAGDNIVASPSLYGGTIAALANNLPRYGITTRFVEDPDDPAAWVAATDERTVAYFGETIPNPKNDILDLETIAKTAHEQGVPLIVDNTVATPYLIRPIEWGADIVIHSVSKYLGGHGNVILGAIVDSGKFDWAADPDRFRQFHIPDPSYHNLQYKDLGDSAFILKCRVQGLRDFGWAASPFNAYLASIGIDTLSLRVQKHSDNALQIAQYLAVHPQVESVSYAGLESSPYYQRAQKYSPKGVSGVFSFDLKGDLQSGRAFVDAVRLFVNAANLGDVRSLIIHPASTTHSQANPQQLTKAGVAPGTIRLSIGIEDPADLIADLERGFRAAAAVAG